MTKDKCSVRWAHTITKQNADEVQRHRERFSQGNDKFKINITT